MAEKKGSEVTTKVKLDKDIQKHAGRALGDLGGAYRSMQAAGLPNQYVGISDPRQQAYDQLYSTYSNPATTGWDPQFGGGRGSQGYAGGGYAGGDYSQGGQGYEQPPPGYNPALPPGQYSPQRQFGAPTADAAFGHYQQTMGQDLSQLPPDLLAVLERSNLEAQKGLASQGGTRFGSPISQNITASELQQRTAEMLYGHRRDQEVRQDQMLQQAPMIEGLIQEGPRVLSGIGSAYETDEAEQIKEQMRQYEFPMGLAERYQAGVAANPKMAATKTKASTPFDWMAMGAGFLSGI